jgi:hypothetical protein
MSDLSGSNVIGGFEEYLTGYPLSSIDMYAFAKTWYAAEMPRPGCAWTHTLLISGADVSEISSFENLVQLFRRPEAFLPQSEYSKPIVLADRRPQENSPINDDTLRKKVASILESLYVRENDNILIGCQNSFEFETAILRVWSQQWPAARKIFSFCTGSLSGRGFAGKPFDIQCTPPSLIHEVLSFSSTKQNQEMSLLEDTVNKSIDWMEKAINDVIDNNGEKFRRYLWKFAGESNRKSYSLLASIIHVVLSQANQSPSQLIESIAKAFPQVNSGDTLKDALLGPKRVYDNNFKLDEGELLTSLATTQFFAAFDSRRLQLAERGTELCSVNPGSARQAIFQLFRSPVNRLGEDILAGMISSLDPALAREVTNQQPQFLPSLFRAKPELGVSRGLWMAAGDHKRELFESLITHENLDETIIGQFVEAILDSDSEFLLGRAIEKWGKAAVWGTLDWVAKRNGNLSNWSLSALAFHIASVAEWVLATNIRSQNAVVLAAHVVAPFTNQIRQLNTDVWLRAYRELINNGQHKESTYFATMLLSLALQNAPPDPFTLLAECFERVHQISWDNALPDEAWQALDPIVPHLRWFHDWDKCERLRRGLVEAFLMHQWPVTKLRKCLSNDELLARVVKSAQSVQGGNHFVSQI